MLAGGDNFQADLSHNPPLRSWIEVIPGAAPLLMKSHIRAIVEAIFELFVRLRRKGKLNEIQPLQSPGIGAKNLSTSLWDLGLTNDEYWKRLAKEGTRQSDLLGNAPGYHSKRGTLPVCQWAEPCQDGIAELRLRFGVGWGLFMGLDSYQKEWDFVSAPPNASKYPVDLLPVHLLYNLSYYGIESCKRWRKIKMGLTRWRTEISCSNSDFR